MSANDRRFRTDDDDDEALDQPAAPGHSGQVRMAYRLAAEHEHQLLHVHGVGWHFWDGRRWLEDDKGKAQRAVLATLRKALRQSLDDRKLRADVTRCESAGGVAGVLAIAAALPQFAATVADLDADPYLLNVANGTLDLRDLTLTGHDPGDRITKVTGGAWDPSAAGPEWAKFLERVLPEEDVRDFLQRYVGLALAGTVLEHRLAILTGVGRNGKGTATAAIAVALGDYAGTADPEIFMHRGDSAGHPTGEMDLRGLRWVVVNESDEGRRLADATVKRLTGGDQVKARRMRQDFVTFAPSHTAALVTNHLPKVTGDDLALWARLRVIPFDVVIPEAEQDPHLGERLALEADAVLSWAVAGWQDYQTNRLAEPAAVMAATNRYHEQSDALRRFVAEECLIGSQLTATASELWERWCRWAGEDGTERGTQKQLGLSLERLGYRARRTSYARMWAGLTLQASAG